MTSRRKAVVVGASAAGVSAALALRSAGFEGPITLIDADPNLPYERPPLSKALLVDADQPLSPIVAASTYADLDIELLLGVRVASLDAERSALRLADGTEIHTDDILIATGLAARPLSGPGAELGNIATLRDAADAARVGRLLRGDGPLVIVGGGFIGLEIAAVARELGRPVTVIEAAPLPLLGPAGAVIAALVRELHESRGVMFELNQSVARFEGTDDVEAITLGDGRRLPAAAVIVGVGVVPRLELARSAEVEIDRHGIVVDAHGRTNRPRIYAAGDVASQAHPALAGRGRLEHWDVALRHGAAVGGTIAGRPTEFTDPPYAWSDQYGFTYQFFGRAGSGDQIVLRDGAGSRQFLAFWLRAGRVTAVAGFDQARQVAAARKLLGAAVDPTVLADPTTDLRALSRLPARSTS